MTNAPNPNHEPTPNSENQPQPTPRHRPRRRGRNILLGLGVVLLVSFGVGVGFAWFFIQRQLAPMVEKNLARLLNRPVNLGQVESFTYNGLRFGASEVPATPTDPDHASMPAIDVAFNPFKLLLTRTLEFDITLIDPEVYLEQSQDGRWLDTRIQQQEKGFIDVKLQEIQVHSADVVLVPRSQNGARLLKPVAIALPNGGAQFLNNNQLIQFNLQGNLLSGGQFRLQGTSRPAQEQTKLAVSGNDLKAPEISRLLRLPLNLHAGEVAGNLEINITEDEPLQLFGTTTLENVTARTAQLPQPFVNTNGLLRFKGTLIGLEDVKSRFGQIPAVANGVLDTQSNYNIVARSQPVTIKQVLQTFKIQETPVPISGEVQAAIQLVGPLNKPIVRGEFVTTKPTQVDRVTFRNISSGFGVVDSTLTVNNLRAVPTFGGLVTANGRIGLDEQRPIAFNVQATNLPGTALARNYNVNLPVPVGLISARTQIVGSVNNAQNIRATGIAQANVAGGTVTVTNVQIAQQRFRAQVQAQRVELASLPQIPPRFQGLLSGDFIVGGSLANFSPATLSGTGSANLNIAGGTVSASNIQLNNGRFRAQVQANNVQLSRVADVPPALQSPISASFNLAGSLTNFSTSTLSGTGVARLNVAGGTVTASNVQLNEGRFRAQVQANSVQVGRLAQVPPQFQGPLSGQFTLAGNLDNLSPSTIVGSGSGSLNVAGGTITASNVQLNDGRFRAQVQANSVQVGRLAQVPPQFQGPLSGQFTLAGALDNLSPSTIVGSGSGSLNVAGGTVTASNVQLANGQFRAQVQANSVQVGRLAQVPPQFQSPLSGSFNLAGSLTDFSLAAIQGSGSGRLNVAGGTVAATAQIANGRFSAVVEPTGVQLASFSQDLRGRLAGRLNLSGSLTGFSPSTIQAQGQLNFSEGLAIIDRPLTADIRWNGERLEIARATAQGFDASGVVDVNLASRGVQAIEAFNLNVQAQDLDLQQLPATLPIDVAIAGRADFNGRISGTQNAPNVNGNLQLENFVIEGLAFEPVLSGNVSAVPGQGVNVQLAGTTDQIQVALDPNYQPISFLIQRDESVARGTRQGELLLVNAQDFPIGIIKEFAPLPPAIAAQPLSGRLSGDVTVNLNNRGISGEIAIANPIFGTLRGESFIATLDYTDGNIVLSGGEFIQGESRYLLSGAVNRTAQGPQFQGQLEVNQGQLQDVLVALQLFDLDDLRRGFNTPVYGEKQDVLPVAPVGLPEEPLQTQLRRLSEIDALLAQQRQQEEDASPLPPLSEASGTFTGTLSIVGSLSSGITAEFDIRGQDWEWDQYNAEQVVAEGSFQNGVLTLLPLRFQSGESFASFSGSIGSEEQSGQLQLRNIPVEQIQVALQDATNVPPALVGLTGRLNATATLSGSLANPQARGEVEVLDAMLNQEQVQSAQGSFSYTNARLNFSSTVLVTETDPLNISGSIPYKLPVATVEPENNELTLNIDVQNEGLALLNFFSQGQVSWIDGTGNVKLSISGTYDQDLQRPARLVTEGVAEVQNATIAARALPEGEPLTNVNGRILFDFDQIQVEQLQAQFSDGSITASGTLPISQPAPQENPLSVNIGELAFNLKGLYNGRVAGDVQITGTALAPVIGGEVNLFNGNVFLAESTGAADGTVTASTGEAQMGDRTVAFDDLQLILGRNIEITRPPIISFLADGTLTINGSLGNLRPEGTIRLKRGQVNLFTTQFRLARGYEQTARFTPGQGLDPILDVRLVASVAESSQGRLPTDPLSAEISDAPTLGFGTVQTVRVEARVEGPASQLANNLELTSSPSRSQTEIVALLGGSFVDTLGRGDSTLGLVNLAGSALLSNVQNVIGDALGLSEFRLYPTTITNEERRTSTLGLAAEAGVDLSQSFSVSVSKELTTDQPFRYGLRYRLNDQILLRGDTDLSGDSRAVVEYENRF